MDATNDIRDFLTTRRARITPQQAGLPDFGGGRRRVPGLRREEVAMLAGMSTEYYVRLERGNAVGFSEAVLDGVARALQLDDAERSHLFDLVRAAAIGSSPRARPTQRQLSVRSSLQQTIDAMTTVPVFVQNGRLDAVATNRLGEALFSEMFVDSRRPMNAARFVFLDARAQTFYRDWEGNTRQMVALLRREASRNPFDRGLTDLVGELSTQSELFRQLWASHDVREHRTGLKSIHHPIVGDLDLTFESMDISSERGMQMLVFSAEPGSASADGLQVLASWVTQAAVARSS